MVRFIGRRRELEDLEGLLKKESSSLVVIRGRRRIGKSRLAKEFAASFPTSYFLTGIPPEEGASALGQRLEFARQLHSLGIPVGPSNDWGDLLTDLAKHCAHGRILVVLDEITWMGDLDSTFLPKVKTIWDLYFTNNPKLILLISGSNSSWIEKKLLHSTGFFGRVSYQLCLRELPLHRCNEFWRDPDGEISPLEKFKVLSVTGGIPRYLEEIRNEVSSDKNIFNLCYRPTGILFNEFDQIFSDLFGHRERFYRKIVCQLANGAMTLREIAEALGPTEDEGLEEHLENLIEGGFLSCDPTWNIGKERKEHLKYYRISDNYVRFYLKFIEPYKDKIAAGEMNALPRGWKSILGLQFENLICNNAMALFTELGIFPNDVIWSGPYRQVATPKRQGCQIDYLIQAEERVLYLCEVKFSERPIPLSVGEEAREKIKRLDVPKGHFFISPVLICINGVTERLKESGLFHRIVHFNYLLQP